MIRSDDGTLYIDIGMLFQMLWHHMAIIVVSTLGCAAVGFIIAAFFIAPTYSASADMLVNNNQETATTTTVSNSDITASTSLVDTYSVILKSHTMLEQVIDDLNLDMTYDELSNKISVSAVNSTQVMRITAKTDSANKSLAIVTDIVEKAPDMIIEAAKVGSVDTVDEPFTTGEPVAPSKRNYTMIGALIGLILSAGILILREILNNKIKTEDDVKNILDLQLLGVIPLEEADEKSKRSSK